MDELQEEVTNRPRPVPATAGASLQRPAPAHAGMSPRPLPVQRPSAAPTARPRPEPRPRPDANPMRLMAGFVGLASLSAIASGLLPSVAPAASAGSASSEAPVTVAADAGPQPIRRVTRYVQLKPGQTAPPQASVVAAPKPTPRVVVVTTTRQSGKP